MAVGLGLKNAFRATRRDHLPVGEYRLLVEMKAYYYRSNDQGESEMREDWLVRDVVTIESPSR